VTGTMAKQNFPAHFRLRLQADFDRVYARKQSASDGVLLVFGCENGLPHPRLGLSVARKVGGAVVRNRWKRLLREAFRLSRERLPPGVDFIAIPRAAEPELNLLADSLVDNARRIEKKLLRGRR